MTEITNPLPDDPAGASALDEESTPVDGSQQLLDGGSTGTDEGPGGVPAALTGVDTSSPLQTSSSRGETAASSEPPEAGEGR